MKAPGDEIAKQHRPPQEAARVWEKDSEKGKKIKRDWDHINDKV